PGAGRAVPGTDAGTSPGRRCPSPRPPTGPPPARGRRGKRRRPPARRVEFSTRRLVMPDRLDQIAGALLGTAVGDALGLPREGLSPRRAPRLFGERPLRHRFVLGHGIVSDDAAHTCLVGQALLRPPEDPEHFARSLTRPL